MTQKSLVNRRRFLAAMAASGLFFTQRGLFAEALTLTPSQTEGPYYPDTLPLDQDNDLLVVNDAITPAVGAVAWISGKVLDRNGAPVRGALFEIWQADNYGSYIHSRGALNGRRDSNFQGYGKFVTGSTGEYLFRTIKPGLYPGRVRHVHFKVTLPGGQSLTSQLYIEGETGNDSVLSGIRDAAQRASVIRPWAEIPESPIGALATTFDVVLGYTPPEIAEPPTPKIYSLAGITHAGSAWPGAAGDTWLILHGEGLASTAANAAESVSVSFNGQATHISEAGPNSVKVLAPTNAAPLEASVVLMNEKGMSEPVSVKFERFQPGFFQQAREYVRAVRADGVPIAPAGLIEDAESAPAAPGDEITLSATGFGPDGSSPVVRVWIDTKEAEVLAAGYSSPGVFDIRIVMPDVSAGDNPVTASVDGVRTSKFVRIPVQARPV